MTLLEVLVAYCTNLGILVGDGEDTYRDFMPESPDYCVVFAEYAGQPPSPFIDAVHRSIQVRVRSKDSTEARRKAVQLYKAFSNTTEERRINFTDELWGQVYVRQPPYKINQDRSERTICGFNLGITTNIID